MSDSTLDGSERPCSCTGDVDVARQHTCRAFSDHDMHLASDMHLANGAILPPVAAALTAAFGTIGVGVGLAVLALLSAVFTFALRETRASDMTVDR